MVFICIFLVVAIGIAGGYASRWHGGGFETKTGKFWRSVVWGLPFSFVGGGSFIASFIAAAGCGAGKSTGVGNAIDHNTQPEGKPERIEVLIRWAKPYLSELQYEFLLNVVGGIAAVFAAVVVLIATSHPWLALELTAFGAIRAIAYDIGWIVFPNGIKGTKNFTQPTQVAEFITGNFAYTGLAIALVVLILL